jgi:hypothetical protein
VDSPFPSSNPSRTTNDVLEIGGKIADVEDKEAVDDDRRDEWMEGRGELGEDGEEVVGNLQPLGCRRDTEATGRPGRCPRYRQS